MMLTTENYHSTEMSEKYIGASQFKGFIECEAKALAELKDEYQREDSTALLQGTMFDTMFDGTLDKFMDEYTAQIRKKTGGLYAEYETVNRAYGRVKQDKEWMRLASGQQQVIMTGKIQGIDVKIMIDSLLSGEAIVDRKLMAGFPDVWKDGQKMQWWKAWGYDIQAALYSEIYEQNTGERLPFILAAASKEKATDIKVCKFSEQTLAKALEYIQYNIEHVADVKRGVVAPKDCGECDFCKAKRTITRGVYELI